MLEALLPDYHIWIKVTSGAVIPLIVDGPLDDNGTLSTATSVTSGAVFQHRPRERLCLLTLRVGRPAHTHCAGLERLLPLGLTLDLVVIVRPDLFLAWIY